MGAPRISTTGTALVAFAHAVVTRRADRVGKAFPRRHTRYTATPPRRSPIGGVEFCPGYKPRADSDAMSYATAPFFTKGANRNSRSLSQIRASSWTTLRDRDDCRRP